MEHNFNDHERKEWVDIAANDWEQLKLSLLEIGASAELAEDLYERFLAEMKSAEPKLVATPPPLRGKLTGNLLAHVKGVLQSILLDDVLFLTQEPVIKEVEVPILLLTAPAYEKAAVSFERSNTITGTHEWNITLFGSGLGAKQSISVGSSEMFTAARGESKIIFVPVQIETYSMGLYKDDKQVSEFVKRQAVRPRRSQRFIPAPRLATASEVEFFTGNASVVGTYELSRDAIGSVSTYTEKLEAAGEYPLSLGLKAGDAGSTMKTTVAFKSERKLKVELPGGRDYTWLRPERLPGIVWR